MTWALFWLFVVIQAADVWTTGKGLDRGDTEAMPVGRSLFDRLGFWPTVALIKGGGIVLALGAALFVRDAYWFIGPLCLIGAYVLWNNWRVLQAD